MAEESEEEGGYPQEDIQKCMQEAIDQILENVSWDEAKVPIWINQICERITKGLVELKAPYKYIVTCTLSQKTESKPLNVCFSTH